MSLFDLIEDGGDPYLRQFLARSDFGEARARCDHMWQEYKAVASPQFPNRMRSQFPQCYWEMYLYLRLKREGFRILVNDNGPDFFVTHDGSNMWIEATVPGPGEGPDALPRQISSAFFIPEDGITLRLASAFADKAKQLEIHQARGIVRPGDALIIAISSGLVPYAGVAEDYPRILNVLFPIGPYSVTVDTETLRPIHSGYSYRPHILKRSGNQVDTTAFVSDAYNDISAVIYSMQSPWFSSDSIVVVHNPKATVPAPQPLLKSAQEFVIDGDSIVELH